MTQRLSEISLILICIILLASCGGGSSDSSALSAPSSSLSISISGNTSTFVGDAVDFVVAAPNGIAVTSVDWQVSGISEQPLNAHTQAIGFDVNSAGSYDISVNVSLEDGSTLSDTLTLQVSESTAALAALRLGHEASEGGRVSLRVDTVNTQGLTITDIAWRQTSGATINSFEYDVGRFSHSIYFQAPSVTSDSIIEIESVVTLSNGEVLTDTAQVLVKDIDINRNGYFVDDETSIPETVSAHMQPYRAKSPYATALADCVYNNQVSSSCSFSRLPLIGQVTENPSIDDILDRTYVSHPWMGDAFKLFLETSTTRDDMLQLLRATNAVVISYDIRPSFYWVATGAIYLDANSFWRTPQERDTLNTRPDYRSGFGSDLDFITSWRYIKDGAYYFPVINSSNVSDREPRDAKDVEAALSYLLYHELAHANDFFDHTEWQELSDNASPLSTYDDTSPISTGLASSLPLTSSQLHALAEVSYGGATASDVQRNYTALQVANWFQDDAAVTFYAYFTEREDLATLFERFMMLYRLDAEADVGVFTRDTVEDSSFIPTWAQRNRVSDDNVAIRVNYAVSRILPNLNVPAIQASLPTPYLLPNDITWRESASSTNPNENLGANEDSIQRIEAESVDAGINVMSLAEEFATASAIHGKKKKQ